MTVFIGSVFAEDKPTISFFKKGERLFKSQSEVTSTLRRGTSTLEVQYSTSFNGYSNNISFIAVLYRSEDRLQGPDILRIWKKHESKYELLVEMGSAEISAVSYFGDISIFKINKEIFIDVPMLYSGTGHFRTDTMFELTHDNELRPVEFTDAAKWFAKHMKENEAPDGGNAQLVRGQQHEI
jgi:hypothetical protein